MQYKPDWEETKQRFQYWWAGEIWDRVALAVTAPQPQQRPSPTPPEDPKRFHTDPDWLVERFEAAFHNTWFGGEAFPCPTLMVGYAFLSTSLTYQHATIWIHPCIEDYQTDLPLLDFASEGWQLLRRVVTTMHEAGRDKWLTSFPTVMCPTDLLANLRRNDRLCIDMLERPEEVQRAIDYFIGLWIKAYGELGVWLECQHYGSSSWLPLWSPGMSSTLQCDFSCMISASLFRRFVAPELQARARWLTNAFYHLDGPGALHHLDALCEIPEIRGIQWVPGAGQPGPLEWLPWLRRIQAAGKNLHISIEAKEVERALEELKPEGLFINTSCDSIEEGRQLLRLARRKTSCRR